MKRFQYLLLILTCTFPAAVIQSQTLTSDGLGNDSTPPSAVTITGNVHEAHHHDHHAGQHIHDSIAPIGVMGEHMHEAGEFMLSYRYMVMRMDGNRDGNDRLADSDVRAAGFPVVPVDMTMQMHMLGAMYAPTDDVTLMAMGSYLINDMDHIAGAPLGSVAFSTRAQGFGDTTLAALIRLYEDGPDHLHLNAGVSLPTGSITETDNTPLGVVRLPYPMQLGSGTYDLKPGLTYTHTQDTYSFGAQTMATLRLDENEEGYALGDRFEATAWIAKPLTSEWSVSGRLAYETWGDIKGRDAFINPAVAPTARPDLRSGHRVDALFGVNYYAQGGTFANNRLALEVGLPVFQDLDGPQLETDWTLTLGWQLVFQ